MKRLYIISGSILLLCLGTRLFIALKWPDDEPDDGRVYAQIAKNILDRHCYSIETEDPVTPTYIRVPGYPVFLAGVYKLFGHDNNRAVRIIQALVSTATCLIVALIALAWAPESWDINKKRRAFLIALALAAACPAIAIYVAVILTEAWAIFFIALSTLAATYAMKATARRPALGCWIGAGLAGGIATMLRPDSAIFVAAIGATMVLVRIFDVVRSRGESAGPKRSAAFWKPAASAMLIAGLALSTGFALALTPWTIRNERVFHTFQPIAPEGAGMPGEFTYSGYLSWLKTWVTDQKWIEVADWSLDYSPIHVWQLPDSAFDSPDERDRVAQLFTQYNKEPAGTQAQAPPPPKAKDSDDDDDDDSSADDDSDDGPQESSNPNHKGLEYDVQMTPEIDAGFGQIARERTARHPFRSYVGMPFLRAVSMWFDTHSQYYPFQGELFPLSKLDKDLHQQILLPLFALITLIYTSLVFAGAVVMWLNKDTRRWLLLLALLAIPRLAFLSTLENPEPRYVVELFPFVIAAGALFLASLNWTRVRDLLRRGRTAT
jgi:hypothetical protein